MRLLYSVVMINVATHSGSFHPDEVFAVATLQLFLGDSDLQIIRTRDESVIEKADWVIDVGGVYDVETNRFDHHQNGSPMRDNGIPYSSFGLVWKHLGEQITGSVEITNFIEEAIAQPVDAGDNGVNLYTLNELKVAPCEMYSVIGSFKPVWGSDKTEDEAFVEAVDFARGFLERKISFAKANIEMKQVVQAGYEAAENKALLVFDEPVNRHSFIEYPDVNVIVYPSESSGEQTWRAVVIATDYHTFSNRAEFPEAWAGLRDVELAAVSGIEDAVFCHKGRYFFVAHSKEGAIKAAQAVESR